MPSDLQIRSARHIPREVGDLDRELKYTLPAGRMPFVERWLATVCRPDPQHAQGDVWTVYYDTPDCASLDEKLNSDYLKTKLRVRWYAFPQTPPAGDAFIEVKQRIGDRRSKLRICLPGAAPDLAARSLADPVWSDFAARVVFEGVTLARRWRPCLMLAYRRARYIEPSDGSRVSCDSGIRAVAAARSVSAALHRGPLPVGVVEIKGRSADELPRSLRAIVKLGGRVTAFSKYAAVFDRCRNS